MKKHFGHLACVWVLIIIFVSVVGGQPGCGPRFVAGEACVWPIQTGDYVFLGRVASVAADPEGTFGPAKKMVVEVEAALKGKLQRTIDLTVADDCFGTVKAGGRHIFTANRVETEAFSGLLSKHWSTAIEDDYTRSDIEALLAQARAVLNKVKQPQIFGTVIQQNWLPDSRHLVAGKFGYDPLYANPLFDVVVTARRKDGLEFRTATGAGGKFVFNDLPDGLYTVSPELPEVFEVDTQVSYFTFEDGKNYLKVDGICGRRVRISTQTMGEVKVRVRGVSNGWDNLVLRLYRVLPGVRGKREYSESTFNWSFQAAELTGELEHVFKKIPAGPYVVAVIISADSGAKNRHVYHPGTADPDKAVAITVETAEATSIDLTIPY